MTKRTDDFLAECREDFEKKANTKIPVEDFKESFCRWCRNQTCVHAKEDDLFTQRISTQWQRLCRPEKADASNPKFSEVLSKEWKNTKQAAEAIAWNTPAPPPHGIILPGPVEPSENVHKEHKIVVKLDARGRKR